MMIRSVPGLATDHPYSFIGREWTTCVLYGGLILGFGFQMTVGVSLL